jgi:pimeloyl-ACP methyl ester carboxylesterase
MRTTLSRRGLLGLSAALAATATATSLLLSPTADATQVTAAAKPTIVLVHGGFADASNSWNDVVQKLQQRGYPVIAPANPLRGLPTDSAYINSVVNSIPGPVILVGHSYGGAVITNAAAGAPNVKALVYIAAFVPDTGESLAQLITQYPGSEIQAALKPVSFPNPDGTTGTDLYIQADKLRQVFAGDLPESTTKIMAATQRPFAEVCFIVPSPAAAWRTIPSWGLVATQDKAIPPALQRFEYQRANARKTVSVAASHVAMVSHPDLVTDLIMDADRGTR